MALKAAALLHSICRHDALVDGNTRVAWTAATVFLDMNGLVTPISDEETFDLVMRVAEGSADVEEIAAAFTLDG